MWLTALNFLHEKRWFSHKTALQLASLCQKPLFEIFNPLRMLEFPCSPNFHSFSHNKSIRLLSESSVAASSAALMTNMNQHRSCTCFPDNNDSSIKGRLFPFIKIEHIKTRWQLNLSVIAHLWERVSPQSGSHIVPDTLHFGAKKLRPKRLRSQADVNVFYCWSYYSWNAALI